MRVHDEVNLDSLFVKCLHLPQSVSRLKTKKFIRPTKLVTLITRDE